MTVIKAMYRSLAQQVSARTSGLQPGPHFKPLLAAALLMFTGNASAVITVGLDIQNDLDSDGDIVVINGGKVKVSFEVIEDTDKDLHKNDKIQLLRVSDDSVVSSVTRGKKKAGSVSLKVKKSEDEQLYVNYVRKGSGTEINRTSHPDDDGIPLLSIPALNIADLTVQFNAMQKGAVSVSGVSFADENGSNDCIDIYAVDEGSYQVGGAGTSCDASAPVQFPDGVSLSSMTCRVYDNNASNAIRIQLRGAHMDANSEIVIFSSPLSVDDSSFSQQIIDLTASSTIVDNSGFMYHLWADFGTPAPGSAIRIYGCSISYTRQ